MVCQTFRHCWIQLLYPSRVPSYTYIQPAGLTTQIFPLDNFFTQWTFLPWVLLWGFRESMKSLKLPPWHLEQYSRKVRHEGFRQKKQIKEVGFFVCDQGATYWLYTDKVQTVTTHLIRYPVYKVPCHQLITSESHFMQVLDTFYNSTWLKSGEDQALEL